MEKSIKENIDWIKSGKIMVLELIHPSRRNYSKIMASKKEITKKLINFLTE